MTSESPDTDLAVRREYNTGDNCEHTLEPLAITCSTPTASKILYQEIPRREASLVYVYKFITTPTGNRKGRAGVKYFSSKHVLGRIDPD